MKDRFSNFNPDEFLAFLPATTGKTILALERQGVEDVSSLANALSVQPVEGLIVKGSANWQPGFWQSIRDEIHALFCTKKKKYESLRNDLEKADVSAQAFVVLVTAHVSTKLGLVASAVIPFAALFLRSLIRLGKEAWCSQIRKAQERENLEKKADSVPVIDKGAGQVLDPVDSDKLQQPESNKDEEEVEGGRAQS